MFKKLALAAVVALAAAKVDQFAEGSPERESHKIYGHVSAAFTPVDKDGELDFTNLEKMAARLHEWGVPNVMVGGTTGESVSFSTEERIRVIEAWAKVVDKYDLNLYVHVGMNSVQEAKKLAATSAKLGAKGIFAMPPEYFRPGTPDQLVDAMAVVASGAPDLPFWYYHFPVMTNVNIDMFAFVQAADKSGKIPNLMGVKYTDEHLMQFNEIGGFKNKKYNMMIGRDEILTAALAGGVADADVGSTVNFISYNVEVRPLFNSLDRADILKAEALQRKTVDVINTWSSICPGYNTQKSIMKMTGIDFGPLRAPQENMPHDMEMQLGTALAKIGVNITDEWIIKEEPKVEHLEFEEVSENAEQFLV